MRRWDLHRGFVLGLASLAAASSGCDSDSFAPPPPTGSRPSLAASGALPVRAREIVLVLPAEENADLATLESVCRLEAGNVHAIYRVVKPKPGEAGSTQGSLIRQAGAEGASAIVLVPDKAKDTAEALAALDPKKTAVVVLGRPLDSPSSGSPYTLITFPSFTISAKRLVEAIAEDVKKAGFPPNAPAILLTSEPVNETSAARDAALLDALKAAKIDVAATIAITDPVGTSRNALDAAIKDHPDLCAILSDDEAGVSLAAGVRTELKTRGRFMIAGYVVSHGNMNLVAMGQASALAERNLDGLARKAIHAAIDRADGKTLPERVEVDLPFRRAASNTVSPIPLK